MLLDHDAVTQLDALAHAGRAGLKDGVVSFGLGLAGQIADGVVLNAVCSPEYTVNALRIIRESAAAAAKEPALAALLQ